MSVSYLPFIFLIFICTLSTSAQANEPLKAESYSGKSALYAYMLTSNNSETIRLVGKSIVKDNVIDPKLLDLAALKIFTMSEVTSDLDVDAASWLANALKAKGQAKHASLLDLTYDKAKSRKFKSYIRKAQNKLPKLKVKTNLEGDKSSLKNLHEDLLKKFKNDKTPKKGDVELNMSIDEVVSTIGYPFDVKAVNKTTKSMPFIGRIKYTHMEAYFDQIGQVVFDREDKEHWYVIDVIKNSNISDNMLDDQLGKFKQALFSEDALLLRKTAKSIIKQNLFSPELLDYAAERILTTKTYSSDYMVDAISWVCKALAASDNSRYYSALKTVAESSTSSKVRGYAESSYEQLNASDKNQYSQGMIYNEKSDSTADSPN
ncbi:hypothetical protein [Pleionea mediterranea]|uniref:Uncharacterized protein n=1 Tax=Pleionea mediterranea TaxID=523701 RepID=A0A316FUA8_9GAMM|nr:hypothetical protein [Pleionea mediterranea]PWK51973.1 hypothetical protein C8D97_105290 [Pleionea mediterranea]